MAAIVCALVLRTHPKRGSRIHNKRGGKMPAAKLVVIYPVPTDLEQFERRYLEHHVPMAVDRLAGKTKIVATKVLSSAQGGSAPFHRIAEIHFPSMSALQACAASEGAKETSRTLSPVRRAVHRFSSWRKKRPSCSNVGPTGIARSKTGTFGWYWRIRSRPTCYRRTRHKVELCP